jgi:hypothetical protein
MPTFRNWSVLFTTAALLFGCATGPSLEARRTAATPAMVALQAADFDGAATESGRVLTEDPKNPFAALVRAITAYKAAMHDLVLDIQSTVLNMAFGRGFNDRYLKFALQAADKAFGDIDRDLAVAASEPAVDLDLCLACWEYDWNRNGKIDKRDRRLMAVEQDAEGRKIPKDDPRRRPTFRFDYGDVIWARAFIAFHRAAVSLALAFDFSHTFDHIGPGLPETLNIPLLSRAHIDAARQHILTGLDYSDQSRIAYQAEEDDDREWLPNPRQKNHPLPLPVDDALYTTWEGVVSDVRKLVNGEEGLSISELAQLGDHQWEVPPTGYLDVGRMFSEPTGILVDFAVIDEIDERGGADPALRKALGKYRSERMKPSRLLRRLERMKNEVESGTESIDRKLRYLLWIN